MSDVLLDDGEQVTVQCTNLNVQGHDLLLDAPARRNPQGPRFRRAMVHDQNDSLTINFEGDYPGGVTLNGVAEISPLGFRAPKLPLPNLLVRGGISYEVQSQPMGVGAAFDDPPRITVDVHEELTKLQSELAELVAKVKALEAKK